MIKPKLGILSTNFPLVMGRLKIILTSGLEVTKKIVRKNKSLYANRLHENCNKVQ